MGGKVNSILDAAAGQHSRRAACEGFFFSSSERRSPNSSIMFVETVADGSVVDWVGFKTRDGLLGSAGFDPPIARFFFPGLPAVAVSALAAAISSFLRRHG